MPGRSAQASIVTAAAGCCASWAAADYEAAVARAYEGASRIRFEGMQLRRDIGQKALRVVQDGPAR